MTKEDLKVGLRVQNKKEKFIGTIIEVDQICVLKLDNHMPFSNRWYDWGIVQFFDIYVPDDMS